MQSLTASREAPYVVPVSIAIQDLFFLATCLGLVFLNLLTFAYHLTGSTLFNTLSNAVSLLLISYSVYVIFVGREDSGFYKVLLVLACVFVGASYLANYGSFETSAAIKYLSLFTFYVAGRSAPGRLRPAEKWCIYALAVLPFLFKLVGQTKIFVGFEFPDVFAYFPNTNTAALYFAALCFCLSPWFGNKILILQFINAAVMNRAGAALATILAIGMWSFFPLRREVFLVLFALAIAGSIAFALGAMDRLLTGLESMALIWSLNPSTVARLTYKQLIDLTGTTDLSAFFRIIHWTNIWEYYTAQGLGTFLFGYGANQSALIAYIPMPPHNDYLRVMVEYGFFSFLIFVVFVISIVMSLKMQAAKILYTVLLIYFFSENLLDNFTSMALFFSYAGRFTSGRSSDTGARSPRFAN
ncbi:O-antigen ligase family protein [Bradyrhizobium sp. LHD-71]|uniref:O-antigen ligase family protein n=1 Tax=Bradyrhizobium sp. LHD-71 TaxID=3072141 RepID=UPI00280E264C|nr:O-antigen ligase family protein [Bradyrhizobium sp. LHD-71]MDQ8728057.1 O-antigen ligase family protein [Bradyrhizobium sp. LHD-71]